MYLFQRPRLSWERRWWPLVMMILGLILMVVCFFFLYHFGHGLWETYQ